jgi:hypothetical protein
MSNYERICEQKVDIVGELALGKISNWNKKSLKSKI